MLVPSENVHDHVEDETSINAVIVEQCWEWAGDILEFYVQTPVNYNDIKQISAAHLPHTI